MTRESERYRRGAARLSAIDGAAGEAVIAALQDIAPDFADYVIEYPFGDVCSRPGLDLRARQIATISMLGALFTAKEVFAERDG